MAARITGSPSGTTHRVLVTATSLAPAALARLADYPCEVTLLQGEKGRSDLANELSGLMRRTPFDAIISRTLPLTADAIAACPALKVISRHGAGYNNVDVAAATARGVPVYTAPGANAAAVAELTIGLLIAAARRVPWMDAELRSGRWSRFQGGLGLSGGTLGIVGFGAIGRRVATAALGLGMTVVAFDPMMDVGRHIAGVEPSASLDDLLARSDALTLHVPLNSETTSLIGARELALLRPGAVVVNTARSPIIDEGALVDSLRTGHLSAAGLDLTADSALPSNHPLLSLDNVVLTPHVGGSTQQALAAVALRAVDNALGFLAGDPPDPALCVNPDVLIG